MAKIAVFVAFLLAVVSSASAYNKQCAVGPKYWCQSFQNAKECGALRHCTDTVWRYNQFDIKAGKTSTSCYWCKKIVENIEKAGKVIGDNQQWAQSTLLDGCKLLPNVEVSNKCQNVVENYGDSVWSLVEHKRFDTLCTLMDICSSQTVASENSDIKKPMEMESKMLCHVIVRATYELHKNEQQNQAQIQSFLAQDCEKLSSPTLIKKCKDLIDHYGNNIYAHVASNVELSRVCDYLGEFSDHQSSLIASSTYCDVCQFVLANAQYMLSSKFAEHKVLTYIDEQVCDRLTHTSKQACKKVILNDEQSLLRNLRDGTKPALLCNKFHICTEQSIVDESSIDKASAMTFVKTNVCEKLGSLSGACVNLLNQDSTGVVQELINHVNGNELCHIIGLCPEKSPLFDEVNLTEDPAKCTRCVKDFTRRKHIAERLVNHSSEFLHHFCQQLPNPDECVQAIDDSFTELLNFIHDMNPRDICVQLNMCDAGVTTIYEISDDDNVIQNEVFNYLKAFICPKTGSLSNWCQTWLENQGWPLIHGLAGSIDYEKVCEIVDVCPSNSALQQCTDKCQCCKNKIDAYQIKIVQLTKSIVASTRNMCHYMPAHDTCLRLADIFESNINRGITTIKSEKICQHLSFCPTSVNFNKAVDCQTCQKEWNTRKSRFQVIYAEVFYWLSALTQQSGSGYPLQRDVMSNEVSKQLENLQSDLICAQMGYCQVTAEFEPSPIQLQLRTATKYQKKSFDQRLNFQGVCSKFGWLNQMCEHLLISSSGKQYGLMYEAVILNNPEPFNMHIQEKIQVVVDGDQCTACKGAVRSAKDFWINSLDAVREALVQSCERCPVKDECETFFNQHYESIKQYLNAVDDDKFCQSLRLCSATPQIETPITGTLCTTCVERLNQRKVTLQLGLDRLTNYLSDVCQRFELKPCQAFMEQLQQSFKTTIDSWNTQEICTQIGFCTTTDPSTWTSKSFDDYESYVTTQIETQICSELGPLQSWCRQILHGNREQIQTVKINENFRDLMQIGASKDENLLSAVNLYRCENDRCQCCVDRITQKKEYLKSSATQVFNILNRACDYCPVKDQCRKYWTDEQNKCIPAIENIDPKQACVQMGYCNASTLCSKMGIFQEECEHVLNKFIQSSKQESDELTNGLPKTSVKILTSEETTKPVDDSKTTCIMCEYAMKILVNYIHKDATEEEIQKSLEQVCQRMPSNLRKPCDEFVDNYGAAIIATVLQDADLTKLCQKLNICTKTMNVNVESLSKPNMAACGVCDYVSTYVHFALKRDPSDASLQEALSKVCTHLSKEQTSQCEMLVQLFGSQMRHLQLDLGENFCQQLAICETPMSDLKPAIQLSHQSENTKENLIKESDDDQIDNADDSNTIQLKDIVKTTVDEAPQCLLCHYVISYLDAFLKNNKSEAAVEAALSKVCKVLPKKERGQCENFVKDYGPLLADLVTELADPSLICRYLGLCQIVKTAGAPVVTYGNHDYIRLPA